ncbi:MAG: MFS transporter [Actinobacteria bacterium]|uniref:Unannotated protein n=1 Tax=freshwater metagenome TaxID=449393 RepID=A0A6J7CUM0_9ZZZZ|nr:MFS transporter [Actinomycetota bacterium]MSX24656.1 MFS transporter [Actinomycetota bacterium]MSY46799.1 MFS transporter [Actinomycetota bacterium]MSY57417.1 MFS transporter [Actinomycetota bacterium]MTA99995.1 MFS transporter [Actinomycetota bacterium]
MKSYRDLLRVRHVKTLILAAFPARIAYGMVSLAIFFKATHETNSIPTAGLAIGLNGLAGALTSGIRGSLIDHYGQKWPLRVLVPGYALMLVILNFAHSSILILALAFILGLSAPPINLSIRPLWKSLLAPEQLRTAYALDTAIISAAGVIGPIVATTLALSSHPESALLLCSFLIALGGGCLALTHVSRTWNPEKRIKEEAPLWRHPAMRLLALEGCFIGFGWGAFGVAVPAFATLENLPHRTAWVLSTMGIFNIAGGLLGGLASKKRSSLVVFKRTYIIWLISSLPLAFTYPGWSMVLVGAALGLSGGALQVFYWEVMEAVRPRGSATGSLGWLWTVEGSFASFGAAVGGWISQAISPRVCLGITTLSTICGLVILSIGTPRLSAADKPPAKENAP